MKVIDQWTGRDGYQWRGVRMENGVYVVQRRLCEGVWL